MNLENILKLINEIRELDKTRGLPMNGVKTRKVRKELTDILLKEKKERLEVGNYVLQVGYTNKDRSRPYTMIFTKENFLKAKEYKNKILNYGIQ